MNESLIPLLLLLAGSAAIVAGTFRGGQEETDASRQEHGQEPDGKTQALFSSNVRETQLTIKGKEGIHAAREDKRSRFQQTGE
ncbi:MAG: hypothetical protein HY315_10580 [Acidobacteria bacterium]|nr:hypothetical protein [Acidobacteriota bacterium]